MISEIGFIKLRKSVVISSAELFERIKAKASEYNLGWTLAVEDLERLYENSERKRQALLRLLEDDGLLISSKYLRNAVVTAIGEYFYSDTVAEASSV